MIDKLLEGNKKFREGYFKENKAHYEEIAKGQSPTVPLTERLEKME